MKLFEMTHLVFKSKHIFKEDNPPKWMQSKEFDWWYKDYVLKLDVGERIKSDFQEIERII